MKKFVILDIGLDLFKNHQYHPLQSQEIGLLRGDDSMVGIIGDQSREEIYRICHDIRLGTEQFFFPRHLDDCGRTKSDSTFFLRLLEHIKDIGSVEGQDYGPSDILYLGANLTDYQAAKKVGLNFVALCSEPQDALELKAAGLEERRIICSFPPQIKSVFNELLRALEELDK